jgi:hypothetical protein
VLFPEEYTLAVALAALAIGWVERRWHPELTSWAYGVALAAALGPSVVLDVANGNRPWIRLVAVLIGSTLMLLFGIRTSQNAPIYVGASALVISVINMISNNGTVLALVLLVIIAAILITIGANFEKRRRGSAPPEAIPRGRRLMDLIRALVNRSGPPPAESGD